MTEVDERIIKYLDKESSPEEILYLKEWIKERPENYKYFRELKETWIITKGYDPSFNPDTKAAWAKVMSGIDKKKAENNPFKIYYKVAAIFIFAVSLYVLYSVLSNFGKQDYVEYANYSVDLKPIELSDGSKVWLSKDSKIKYPNDFGINSREISLEGEAYFEVAKNPDKPFTVSGSKTIVTVLGTTFIYRSYSSETVDKLVVNTGKVSFIEKENKSNNMLIESGYKADFNKSTKIIEKTERESKNIFAQRTGRLIFENERFEEIVSSLSKFYNRNYYIKDNGLNDIRITIAFNNQPIGEALKLLETVIERKITDSSQTLVVY